ncbi:MAG TPA: sigma factor-like helix-turn-helix DNA-binding protein, partial [Thermomicrobiaceae bacterium]|nr:sigma factor-like helix-turn-helix DNA-binding protein [Thermomicrobiaceae bacterium]
LADSVGLALLVVLDALSPSERVAFVLHDMFGVPFGEIARIVACSEPAARQLASRARRRVRGQDPGMPLDRLHQSRLVDAFLSAAREGDFAGLLAVLDPDVVLRADATAVKLGAAPETRGSEPVARFLRIARGATPVLIAGQAGAAWLVAGRPRVLFRFTVGGNAIVGVDLVADAEDIRMLNPVVVDVR